jgi:hypothetical protein
MCENVLTISPTRTSQFAVGISMLPHRLISKLPGVHSWYVCNPCLNIEIL